MISKITTYGQFTLQIENYYSPELQDYTTFQITVVTKKPIVKAQKLIDEVVTKEEGKPDKTDKETPDKGQEKATEK